MRYSVSKNNLSRLYIIRDFIIEVYDSHKTKQEKQQAEGVYVSKAL